MTTWQTAVEIPVQPWFADHCFNGRVVLPAVESMLLLAAEVAGTFPEIDIRIMEDVRFAKFLEIPAGSSRVAGLIEYRRDGQGSLLAKLLSRVRFKAATRLKEHGEILFHPGATGGRLDPEMVPEPLPDPLAEVSAEEVYRELVPFGPAYHTLRETLCLSEKSAWGKLKAPPLPVMEEARGIIGSPFPLDGAFHAACVLGQRSADFVPFPAGFARRLIIKPTQPGGSYLTRVDLLSQTREELIFDLTIFDHHGQVYEVVTGVRMRDVSGGTIKPPDWLKRLSKDPRHPETQA